MLACRVTDRVDWRFSCGCHGDGVGRRSPAAGVAADMWAIRRCHSPAAGVVPTPRNRRAGTAGDARGPGAIRSKVVAMERFVGFKNLADQVPDAAPVLDPFCGAGLVGDALLAVPVTGRAGKLLPPGPQATRLQSPSDSPGRHRHPHR